MNSYEYLTQAVAVSGVPKPAPPAILNGLPVELWLIIFRNLVFSFPARSRLSVLFNIISVCHHWSNMAINDASLWTSIVIEVSALSIATPLMLTRSLLTRTKGYAIDVTIVLPDSACEPFTGAHQDALIALLSPHLYHMQSLALTGQQWPHHLTVMNMFCGVELPMLESFAINALGDAGRYTTTTLRIFASAQVTFPRLKTLVMSGAPYTWADFPLENLQSLRITDQPVHCRPSHRVLQKVLAKSKDTIREFEAVDCLEHPLYNPTDIVVKPVVLSALKTLSLGYTEPGEVETFLEFIETPRLETLTLLDQSYEPAEEESTADAEHPPIDDLLRRLMIRLPLNQLRSFFSVNVSFVPGKLDMYSAADVACGLVAEHEMPVLLQFIRRLVSLEELSISGSGKAFLHYMNYMATHFIAETGEQLVEMEHGWVPRFNLPKLRRADVDVQEPNCDVLALMDGRVVPAISGEDGRYYGRVMDALDITVPAALYVEDVLRLERLQWMCPSLRIITAKERFVESVVAMDVDMEVVSDVEMMDCY